MVHVIVIALMQMHPLTHWQNHILFNVLRSHYDQCLLKFAPYYNVSNMCGALELQQTIPAFTLPEPCFVLSYILIGVIITLMFAWCAFNQRQSPVPGSTQPLWPEIHDDAITTSLSSSNSIMNTVPPWTQTGYIGFHRQNIIGSCLYLATMINLLGLQIFLALMTFWDYVQQDRIPAKKVFESETQICEIFEIIAFALTFMLKWPVLIQSLFYRHDLSSIFRIISLIAILWNSLFMYPNSRINSNFLSTMPSIA